MRALEIKTWRPVGIRATHRSSWSVARAPAAVWVSRLLATCVLISHGSNQTLFQAPLTAMVSKQNGLEEDLRG